MNYCWGGYWQDAVAIRNANSVDMMAFERVRFIIESAFNNNRLNKMIEMCFTNGLVIIRPIYK